MTHMVRDRSNEVKSLVEHEIVEQEVDILFSVWLTARSAAALVDRALAPAGLTGDEFAIYSMLGSTAAMTPSRLAQWLAAPPTTVSSYIRRFESRGHVERAANPGDARSYQLALTVLGREALAAARAQYQPVLHQVSDALGDGEATVRQALQQLRPALDRARQSQTGQP